MAGEHAASTQPTCGFKFVGAATVGKYRSRPSSSSSLHSCTNVSMLDHMPQVVSIKVKFDGVDSIQSAENEKGYSEQNKIPWRDKLLIVSIISHPITVALLLHPQPRRQEPCG